MKRRTGSASAFSQETRELIYIRSDGCCDMCGLRVYAAHFHHRNPRRMGGSRNPALGSPSNGLLLHPKCHDYVESHRKESMYKGLLLAALDDPAERPARLVDGWFMLNGDGTKTAISPPSTDAPPAT